MFAVAYILTHTEGVDAGIITKAEFDSGTDLLLDAHEADLRIKAFENRHDAEAWLVEQHGASDLDLHAVPGGAVSKSDY